MVRALWRDRRVRSVLGLVAVLGLYFAVPVQSQSSTGRLIGNLVITTVCMVVVAMVILREFRRMQSGEDLRFTGGQLLIAIEVVLVAFALTYYSLAVHAPGEMSGIQTRIDRSGGQGDHHLPARLRRRVHRVVRPAAQPGQARPPASLRERTTRAVSVGSSRGRRSATAATRAGRGAG